MDKWFVEEMSLNYQTLMHRDGTVEPGAFPTLHWINEISKVVDWSGKSVIDFGCAEGMFCVAVQQRGASRVIGLDVNPDMIIKAKNLHVEHGFEPIIYESKAESYYPLEVHDILIFSMVLQWMDDVPYHFRRLANCVKDIIVCIYRTRNAAYKIPINGKWFPTKNELDVLAITKGFKNIYTRLLLTQDDDKEVYLSIYRRYKDVKPVISAVIKTNQEFDSDWMQRVKKVLPHLSKHIPFIDFIFDGDRVKGYSTKYINGRDLWGDRPFEYLTGEHNVFLTSTQRANLKQMLRNILSTATQIGVAPSDITRRNIMVEGDECYLIDLDNVSYTRDAQKVFSTELLSFLGLSIEDIQGGKNND